MKRSRTFLGILLLPQFVAAILLLPQFASAVTYATLNPADCGTNMTLPGGTNLTFSHNGTSAFNVCRSTISVSTGKWYWEMTVAGVNQSTGVADSVLALNGNFPGNTANSKGYYMNSTGGCFDTTGDGGGTPPSSASPGDLIGFALDMDNGGELKTYRGNVLMCDMVTDPITGPQFAAVGAFAGAGGTFNFGATAFTYTPPAGYCQGLSDVCVGGGGGAAANYSFFWWEY